MDCSHYKVEIESDDILCWNCGELNARGYNFLKDEKKSL